LQPEPQQGRRTSLAFTVFLVFLAVYMQMKACGSRGAAERQPPPAATSPSTAPPPAAAEPPPAPLPSDVPADDQIVVDTDVYRARFTNRGAALLELWLKDCFRTGDVKGDAAKEADPANWLPLVPLLDPKRPTFALRRNPSGDAPAIDPIEQSNWLLTRTARDGMDELAFAVSDGEGRRFEKLFRFHAGRHDFEVELRFLSERAGLEQGTDSYLLLAAAGIWDERSSPFQSPPVAVVTDEDSRNLRQLDAKSMKDGPQSVAFLREGLPPFVGALNNYFAIALLPDPATTGLVENVTCSRAADRFAYERALAEVQQGGKVLDAAERAQLASDHETNVHAEAALRVPFPAVGAPPLVMKFDVYAGARSPEVMRPLEYEPFRVLYEVEYGSWTWLRWINQVLLWWLRLMHALTRNWGVAIILLTLTVKVLLFPLNRMQSRSMEQFQKKMKVLQPQLEELKKKFKSNVQKLHAEQQKIMREHHVRPPLFGCLVVFLQMPVWYGLFQLMRTAPELRQAPFFGWISDLSAPDLVPLPFQIPFVGGLHLLPILMVVAWLVQNRMMPKPADPQQAQMQKMMNFFPFVFGFLLYKYASGQSLYMLTNSVLGMLQMKLLKVTPAN